ncbi:HEXXH motif domain-containing protein [Nocardia sp. NPDC056100]|uniref:HEXXH motif domain-containing protein n=1 Tax=Nocardia sp. NPDC056100 TaxID=3345712 RepID=UPI0035D7A9E0
MPAPVYQIDDSAQNLDSVLGSAADLTRLRGDLVDLRMILMRALITGVDAATAEAAGLHRAYRALAALQSTDPDVVAAMLSYPNLGRWISLVLKRIREPDDESSTPLWADCAYLGWLAAAAGTVCHSDGTAQVVIRDGAVMLPTLGLARLAEPGHCGPCELHWAADGTMRFSWDSKSLEVDSRTSETSPSWLPLRSIGVAEREPRIWLDDLDPFRPLEPEYPTPPRLDTDQVQTWQRMFSDSWQLLRDDHARYAVPMRECLTSLVPLSTDPLSGTANYTTQDCFGSVQTTARADRCQLAVTLIHEVQHSKLTLITDATELFSPDPTARFHAPWRDEPRPILALLHGIYAFFGVGDFWRVHRESDCVRCVHAHAEFELWRLQVASAIATVEDSGLLTDAGRRFVGALSAETHRWAGNQVSAAARAVATESVMAQRTFWQVRNLVPDPRDIADLVVRWDAGLPPTAELRPSILVDQQRIPARSRRLYLVSKEEPFRPTEPADNAQPQGDRAYRAGYLTEAVALYSRELRTDPLRPQPWAGLRLAAPKIFGDRDFRILDSRAEVVAHLYAAVGTEVEIMALLAWLAGPSDTSSQPWESRRI